MTNLRYLWVVLVFAVAVSFGAEDGSVEGAELDAGYHANRILQGMGLETGGVAAAKDFDRWWSIVKPTVHSPPISRDLNNLPKANQTAADALTLILSAAKAERWSAVDKLRDGENVGAQWLHGSNLLGLPYAYFIEKLPSIKVFLTAEITVDTTTYQLLVFRLQGNVKADDGKSYPYMIGDVFIFKEQAPNNWVLTNDLDASAFVIMPKTATLAANVGMVTPSTYSKTLRRTPKVCKRFWAELLPVIEKKDWFPF